MQLPPANKSRRGKTAGLNVPQPLVHSLLDLEKFVMASLLHDFAVFHDNDSVHLHDSGKPMSNNNRGPSFHEFFQRVLNIHLTLAVKARGGLV